MLILKAADGAFSLQTDILFEASHNQIVNIMFILFRSLAFVESLLYVFFIKNHGNKIVKSEPSTSVIFGNKIQTKNLVP